MERAYILRLYCLVLAAAVVRSQGNCQKKSDIVFVLDQTGSIEKRNPTNGSWDNWQLIKHFVITFMQNATVSYDGIHFGLVTFGNTAVKRFSLSDYYNITSMAAAVQAIQPENGETNTWAGLNMMRTQIFNPNNGARPDVPHIAIVITDDPANINTSDTIPEAQQAYIDGIRVYVIGMTNLINETQLQLISSPPQIKGQNYWTTPDYSSLSSVMGSIATETCNPQKTVYPMCEAIDIAFAVPMPPDAVNWKYITNFMKSFINNFLPIGDQATRVAVITYNYMDGANTQISLGQHHSEADVKAAIDQLTYTPDMTGDFDDIAAMQAISMVFNTSQRRVQQVAIIVFGRELLSQSESLNFAGNMQRKNIRVIAIDATNAVNLHTLRNIASKTRDVIQTVGFQYMQTRVLQLGSILCQAPNSAVCPKKADIVFLLDESTSIVAAPGAYDNWNVHILGFVEQVIDSFPISQDLTRIGVVKFSTTADPNERIYLNQYNNSVELRRAVNVENIIGGESNLADGMRTARTVLFSASNGARMGIPHLLIILTDGKATREEDQTVPETNLTKTAGIEIFTIGMTNQIDVSQLKSICSDPVESHNFYANDYSELSTIIADVVVGTCAAAQPLPPTTTATTTTTSSPKTTTTTTLTISTSTTATTTTTTNRTPLSTISTGKEWYRFEKAVISTACVPIFRCGTKYSLWINSTDSKQTSVQLCIKDGTDCCSWSRVINVQRCLDPEANKSFFYLYEIPEFPIQCSYAICSEEDCPAGRIWTSGICADTSPIASPTSVSDHAPGTISTLVSNGKNGANSNDASSVGAIIGIPLGSVLIGTVISIIIVVYIRKKRSKQSSDREDRRTEKPKEFPKPTLEKSSHKISEELNEFEDIHYNSYEELSRDLQGLFPNIVTKGYTNTNDVPTWSATELKKIRILGRGGYGDVYIAEHSVHGTVAYKEIRKARSSDLKEEANIQKKLRHPNIVKLIAIVSDPFEYQGIVLEYVENGDLLEYIRTHSPDCRFRCLRIKEICSGMNYLHSLDPPIIHGDLKIENVLLGEDYNAKICDFGYSKENQYSGPNSRSSTLRGTCTHIPPEVWVNPSLRRVESYDVYSFGILMWETLAGEKPFNGEKSSSLIREWILKNVRPDMDKIPHEISENMTTLMKECWGRNAVTRPAFKDIEADFRNGKYSDELSCSSV